MTIGIWILGDQLSLRHSALQSSLNQQHRTEVILIEALDLVRQRPYHRQKLVLVWSAMRHFAMSLRQQGWSVTYQESEDFASALTTWIQDRQIQELCLMTPADRPLCDWLHRFELTIPLRFYSNSQFLWSPEDFSSWAKPYRQLRMEYFYRESRQRFDVLMADGQPVGGQWNFDRDNRRPPSQGLHPPAPLWFEPDSLTKSVISKVQGLSLDLFGELLPFRWAVTRQQALAVLDDFLSHRLAYFGPYQDAMLADEPVLWHSLLSPYLNLGLLGPLEVIRTIEQQYYQHQLPLASVEGCIRQILGWREYLYGLYHYFEPDYTQLNWFDHQRPLPTFFWTTETDLFCLRTTLQQVAQTGYAHHIQRLMILANFALIAGLNPQAVEDWFHATFIDAYDWVMQTNVIGMGLFADGGRLASKPYAASANYINRMSNYCAQCVYDPKQRTGDRACPFNFLYWDFLDRHRERLASLGRMGLVLRQLEQMDPTALTAVRTQAHHWRDQL
jgi:deoxyribodipyrimidine photolyase-related protein